MENETIRFACNGCGVCCKGRLIPLTLDETRHWLARGHDVAVLLEAFDETTWPTEPQQFAHSAQRAADVDSGSAQIKVIAVFTANALGQCPNLGLDDRCGIYHDRPLVCRIYPMEINPFISMDPKNKACPPQVWEAEEVIFTDRIVDPVLASQVQQSRLADRGDAQAKIEICESMGLKVAAWKGNALAVYQPDRLMLANAIEAHDAGFAAQSGGTWKVRVDQSDLSSELRSSGIAVETCVQQSDYIFHEL
ncbi:YkgJ family cysteine cluster protein [Pseudomonas syringae group genomosp. 3]|uniref:YkgJ family cysteine cluster protein n=1 Tax=Pseudomonas syringae group genomosp. 3 TaxID=251701 RepID=UPI0005CA70AD|nr:YkgJ family cysteine cluster protein [Pseudomonas syringae group genomosp. 3]